MLGPLDARAYAELMWRQAEHRLELSDEMERRDLDLPRHLAHGRRVLLHLAEQIARPAQARENISGEKHSGRLAPGLKMCPRFFGWAASRRGLAAVHA